MDHSGISRTSSPTSTCLSPATSLENLSSAESEWSTSSGWSFPSSAPPSRVCSPQLLYPSPSDSPPPPSKVDYSAIIQLAFKSANKVVPPSATFNTQESSYHEVGDTDACGSEIGPSRRKKRIPRPPNAFMLFRAKEVNARLPYDLENRQQLVSVIAGHAWNLLKESDKAVWKEMSKTIQAEHMEKYPDYKFSPSRKPGRKDQVGGGADGQLVETREDFQRRLREKYLKIVGPSVASPRTRKPKKSRKAAVGKQSSIMLPSLLPTPLFSQPSEVPQTSAFNSTDGLSSHNPALYMPSTLSLPAGVPPPHIAFSGFDWSAIVPHIPNDNLLTTQPSASASSQAGSLHEDPHILSDLIDNEKTPTAATFGHIAAPPYASTTPLYSYLNSHLFNLSEIEMQSDFSGLTSGMYSVQPHMMPTASAFSLQGARDSRYWSQYLDPRFSGISNLSMSVPPFGMNDVPCDSSSSSPLSSKTLAEDVKETSGIKPSPDKM